MKSMQKANQEEEAAAHEVLIIAAWAESTDIDNHLA
jgi:hypothetical protein